MTIVDRVYEGAMDAQAWPGIVRDLADFLRSPKGLLLTNFVSPTDGGLNIASGIRQSSLEKWNAHYIPHDIWTAAAVRKGLVREGAAVTDHDLVPEQDFLQSKIYRELLREEGVGRVCAGFVFVQQERGMHTTTFGVYRDIAEPRYGERERELMTLLVPHLSRSLGVMYRLREAELTAAANLDSLDRLVAGVVLLDSQCRVRHLNRAARRIVDAGDGLALTPCTADDRSFRLIAHDARAQSALDRACAEAVSRHAREVPHFSAAIPVPRPSARLPLVLQLGPLPPANSFSPLAGEVSAIAFITEQDRAIKVDARTLKHLYQLTDAEIGLAGRLCAGNSLESAARHLGISASTAKSQLSAIFQKTATHRQADLVRLLVSLESHVT